MNGLMGISNKYTLVSCKSMVKRHYYIYMGKFHHGLTVLPHYNRG